MARNYTRNRRALHPLLEAKGIKLTGCTVYSDALGKRRKVAGGQAVYLNSYDDEEGLIEHHEQIFRVRMEMVGMGPIWVIGESLARMDSSASADARLLTKK